MKIWKIYCHIFPNGKRYIGKTCQRLCERFKNGKGYYGSPLMDRAIKKYGWENIEHIVLEENLTIQESIEREQFYIKKFNTCDYENGYNLTNGGEGVLLYDYDDILSLWNEGLQVKEIAERMGCCRNTVTHVLRENGITAEITDIRKVEHQRKDARKVKQYDLNGKYLATYDSCGQACKINDWINKGRGGEIRRACNGERPTARGYRWSWDDGTTNDLYLEEKDFKNIKNKKVGQYNEDGELINIFSSSTEAAEKIFGDKKRSADIISVCYGKRRKAKGFCWKFIKEGE